MQILDLLDLLFVDLLQRQILINPVFGILLYCGPTFLDVKDTLKETALIHSVLHIAVVLEEVQILYLCHHGLVDSVDRLLVQNCLLVYYLRVG